VARPFADISKVALLGAMEMVYRALPFYVRAAQRGETESGPSRGHDLIAYLVANAKLFGLVKRKRSTSSSKKRLQPPLTDVRDP